MSAAIWAVACMAILLNALFNIFLCSTQNISPLDDLAFDMYQDPEVAQIIRKLEKKKQEAALRKLAGYTFTPPRRVFYLPSAWKGTLGKLNEDPFKKGTGT